VKRGIGSTRYLGSTSGSGPLSLAGLVGRSFTCLLVLGLLISGCGKQVVVEPERLAEREQQEEQATPPSAQPAGNVILMDGELVSVYPTLELGFPANASGTLLTIDVRVGQRVKRGERIATLDDEELREAVADAQLALDRAIEDLAQAQADAEETYQDALEDAQEKYEQEMEDAVDQYERELEEAQDALEQAQIDLRRTRMQPPTAAVRKAEISLNRALVAEAEAEDNYKQALDRPWEPQSVRDSYFKEWKTRIADRELAELDLQDAQDSQRVYEYDLQTKEQEVEKSREKLDQVTQDEVKRDEVKRETDFTSYERAVADAQADLAQAREDLADASLYAPRDGLVLSIDANVGAAVSSGTIVTLLDIEGLYFVTENLSERHVAQLRTEQQANITLRAYPDTVLGGQVDTVVPETERSTDADARFKAYIRLDRSELDLLPGMTGRVEITAEGE
jgi:multidrug efflux pump subunit AcrA (membrane-fusion protein)